MPKFYEIEQKLVMADYLLSRDPSFPAAAIKHIVEAANSLIAIYLKLGKGFVSPALACKRLAEIEEAKLFAKEYAQFWKLPLMSAIPHEAAINAYKATKAFLKLVKKARLNNE